MTAVLLIAVTLVLGALLVAGWVLAVTGALTLDTGVGRRARALGPVVASIAAPRELVFEQLALPYLSASPPRALREKVTVLERGDGMVLAAHRTRIGPLTATTVETVVFDRPRSIEFRLIRGPVPYVVERFELSECDGGTELLYTGTLGTDFWLLGRAWGAVVARQWERAVAKSLQSVRESAERSAGRAAARVQA